MQQAWPVHIALLHCLQVTNPSSVLLFFVEITNQVDENEP